MRSVRAGTSVLLVGVVGALTVTLSTAYAGDARRGTLDDDRAVELLREAAEAMRTTSYTGTRMVSSWGRSGATTVVVDVEHAAGQGTTLAMRGGGVSREAAMFLAAGSGEAGQADDLTVESLRLLTRTYDVALGAQESVAGRPARVIEVSDEGRQVARLWIDDESGLLLRREVVDTTGRLMSQSAFIDVDIDDDNFLAHLPPAAPESAAHGVGLEQRSQLETGGWDCPTRLGELTLVGIRSLQNSGALHLSYSDGLTRASVFEQRGRLDQAAVSGYDRRELGNREVYVREGMPSYVMWQSGGLVFTVVTDGPVHAAAPLIARTGEGDTRDPGLWTRVGTGMARIGLWLSPLSVA